MSGEEIQITLYDAITGTPAAPLAVAGWMHAIQNGYGDGSLDLEPDLKAFVASLPSGHEQEAAAVMTWFHDPLNRKFWIKHVFVVEEHRGKGLFTELMNNAIAMAMSLKATEILLAVSAKNKPARSVYSKLGFTEQAIICSHEV